MPNHESQGRPPAGSGTAPDHRAPGGGLRRPVAVPRWVLLTLAIGALVAIPTVAAATHVFDDVDDASVHAPGIEYVADRGITAGCTADDYCPGDELTRAQMGTFLYRASGHDPATPPSVNAAELEGRTADEVADIAGGPQSLTGSAGELAYVWADQPGAASYTPSTTYSHNPTGSGITIERDATGDYSVMFTDLDLSEGHVQVSKYGTGAGTCHVQSWGGSTVNVLCFDMDGNPADLRYTVLFVD